MKTLYGKVIISENVKNIGKNKNFFIRTYGCQSNVRDSEAIAGIMQQLGFLQTTKIEQADFIILNTCAIREKAEQKVFGEIGLIQKLRRIKPNLILAVCGCMMQEPHVVKKLKNSTWGVDVIFGTNSIHKLPTLIESTLFTTYPSIDVYNDDKLIVEDLPSIRNSKVKAFVNVMFGCSNYCTFCIVPFTRGKERSRKLDDIISEINLLIGEGYQEITLLGQNVNNYGLDLQPQLNFEKLLIAVAKTKIKRIRFTTNNPWNFNHRIIDIVMKYPNLMPSFHLPIQSGNNEILEKMNRYMPIEQYKDIIIEIRNKIPNASITTDLIVGFPNETDKQYKDTLNLYDFCKFDNAYTFIYSPRKNTLASEWSDNISNEIKKQRLQELNKKVTYYAKQNNLKWVNQFVKVLVEGKSKKNQKNYMGYTLEQKLVNFQGANDSDIGKFVTVKIIAAKNFTLDGIKV